MHTYRKLALGVALTLGVHRRVQLGFDLGVRPLAGVGAGDLDAERRHEQCR